MAPPNTKSSSRSKTARSTRTGSSSSSPRYADPLTITQTRANGRAVPLTARPLAVKSRDRSGGPALTRWELAGVVPPRDQAHELHKAQAQCTASDRYRGERREGQKNYEKCSIHWIFPPEIGGNPCSLTYGQAALWQPHGNTSREAHILLHLSAPSPERGSPPRQSCSSLSSRRT